MNDLSHRIRPATAADIPAIRAMQARSLRHLGAGCYDPAVIGRLLATIGTMDDAVVHEGNYLVAVSVDGAIVGSGGWSRIRPGYAAATDRRRAAPDRATIRSVFVDPAAARRGIASAIMARAEAAAADRGVVTLELSATLTGVPLYARLGYRPVGELAFELGDGARFPVVRMRKVLRRGRGPVSGS
jgi:GNAT superfamily N-acetyltransferase